MGRIIDYVLDTALAAADTLVIDNATDGTRKTTLDVLANYILATHVNSSITKNVVAALAECVKTSAIVNNLTTTAAGSVLDARQGKVLKDSVDELNSKITPGASYIPAYSYNPQVSGALVAMNFGTSTNDYHQLVISATGMFFRHWDGSTWTTLWSK